MGGGVGWVAHKILVTAQVLGFGLDFGLGLVNTETSHQQMQIIQLLQVKGSLFLLCY